MEHKNSHLCMQACAIFHLSQSSVMLALVPINVSSTFLWVEITPICSVPYIYPHNYRVLYVLVDV